MITAALLSSIAFLGFLGWIFLKPLWDLTFDARKYEALYMKVKQPWITWGFGMLIFLGIAAEVFGTWFVVHRSLRAENDLSDGAFFAIFALNVGGVAIANVAYFHAIATLNYTTAIGTGVLVGLTGGVSVLLIGLTATGIAFWVALAGVLVHAGMLVWYAWWIVRRACLKLNQN